MNQLKIKFAILFLLASVSNYAQLGFCSGSKGDPVFTEDFGNGTTAGPALTPGTTTYGFSPVTPGTSAGPNDGLYTIQNTSNFYAGNWHNAPDHTPDATNGPNGKMLIVNAAITPGDFYKKTVTGLCVNTTFEFSAWMMNVFRIHPGNCAPDIPVNVRFEIWNSTETVLLASGDTGNIFGTPSPLWQQFALAFTTVSDTSVVLKMKNNGLGGCGNDLAIDDISFSACADLTTVSSPTVAGNTYTTCSSPTSLTLNAATAGAIPYFYQWQTSTDGTTWTDITGANSATYTTPNLTTLTYFRTRAAQDLANLANIYCSTISNVFTVDIQPSPAPAVSNGNQTICSGDPIPTLSVNTGTLTGVNWYNAPTGGTLLQANSSSYTPTAPGTYYAETYNLTSNCIGSPRTPVSLTVVALPDVTITGTTSICGGNTAVVSFTGTPNAVVTYTDAAGSHTITLNGSGTASFTTPFLTATATYNLVSVALGSCSRNKTGTVTITVNNIATASIATNAPVCSGSPATVTFTGTPNAVVSYTVGSSNQNITLNGSGSATVTIPSVTGTTAYTLTSVSVGGSCTQGLSQSINVSDIPLPTATISASPLTICAGQTSTVTFNGTPNATVTYTNGSGNQTILLNGSGTASFVTSPLTANATYTLVSAAAPVSSTCSRLLAGAVTIAVNSLPTATITSNAPVCSGSSATVTFNGTPNATVSYTAGSASQNITLNGSGTASVTIPNVTTATTYTLTGVTAAAPNGCTKTLTQSVTVSATALPTATISANPTSVCSGQSSLIHFNGTPNAVVTYSDGIGNQTATLNGSGTASVGTGALTGAATYQLVSVSLAGCSRTLSNSVSVSINPTPNVVYTGNLSYCEGDAVAINLSSAIAGTTFNWTVTQNGTSGAAAGTGNQIAQTLALLGATAGTATYTVTPTFNGCVGNPINLTVTINPLPIPKIVDGVICTTGTSQTSYVLDTNLSATGHTFQWFFGGSSIPGASGNTYSATQVGTYTVIATSSAGCASLPVNAVVGQTPRGESLVISQSEAFSDSPMVTVTVIGGDGTFLYQLDEGAWQTSNVFYNLLAGTHTIKVADEFCTDLSTTVTIIDYPKFFTPNGDGFNDTWNIKGVDNATITIFDRYGKLLKQISSEGLGWDGTYNGRLLPSTDYWFTIDYTQDEISKTFKAHFAMKR